jgi:hypothetical protein
MKVPAEGTPLHMLHHVILLASISRYIKPALSHARDSAPYGLELDLQPAWREPPRRPGAGRRRRRARRRLDGGVRNEPVVAKGWDIRARSLPGWRPGACRLHVCQCLRRARLTHALAAVCAYAHACVHVPMIAYIQVMRIPSSRVLAKLRPPSLIFAA